MEEFKPIQEFPGYEVSNQGAVLNTKLGHLMMQSPTQYGELTVGLFKEGTQYRRSVKVLVARAFVQGETDVFNTPIVLDGDRENLWADNIAWRPRWFAVAYTKQFDRESHPWWYAGPLIDINDATCKVYQDILAAGIATGVLLSDIRLSLSDGKRVFPTGAVFRFT